MSVNTLLTVILTPFGVGISGLTVWFIRRRLRLWEWSQQERRRRDEQLEKLKDAYRILWNRHSDDKLHIEEMQKREQAGDLMWRYFMMDLSMRPLLPNMLEKMEEEDSRRGAWMDQDFEHEK